MTPRSTRARRAPALLVLALVALPLAAGAQERPAVFVHGLASGPDTWAGTAGRLSGPLAIDPHLPGLSWHASYDQQASELQSQLWWLPRSTIAIGHSNGGVVARRWSRDHDVAGLITLGSPNQGAPLVSNLGLVAHYQSAMGWLVSDVQSAFAICCDWDGVWPAVEWWMAVTYWLGDASLKHMLGILGVSIGAPVAPQMAPYSAFLQDLNGGGLAHEVSRVPARVAVVSTAANFYDLGIFGAIGGDQAEYFNALAEGAVWALDYYAMLTLSSAGAYDSEAHRKATRMWNLAAWIDSWDETWCRAVSIPGGSFCAPNDTVVPGWSQLMPGAGAHVFDWGWWGPRHTAQTSSSDDKLYQALTSVMQVPARGAASPGGGGGGGGSGDATGPALRAGDALFEGQTVHSPGGGARLTYQSDGNLVVYRHDGTPLWASHTAGTAPGSVNMQYDGNLVIYDAGGRPLWASHTGGHDGASLTLQDDGVLVIFGGGVPLWSTGW
jgi:hypothetical protein